jgi:hypothetical protein
MRQVLLCIAVLLALAVAASAQEVIGPWDVRAAPVSAAANISSASWLNVVNVVIDENEAFSGFSIIDDGWANIAPGDLVEVTFGAPIPNTAGPDLVLFDAHYDSGTYTVSTDYDGFSASIAVGPGVDSGVNRAYYAGLNNGPYDADIFGMEIELSDLGVPVDGTVTSVRFTSTNSACDPIGLGALEDPIPVELMSITIE